MPVKIQVIHGPNLNKLGQREPELYGHLTLAQINQELQSLADKAGIDISFFQSNHEGAIIDCIHNCENSDGILINPAAYTHTSLAIRDALLAMGIPFVEVHLTDIKKRETFRQHSYFSDIALDVFAGEKLISYTKGLTSLIDHLQKTKK